MTTFFEIKRHALSVMEKSRSLAEDLEYPSIAESIGEIIAAFEKKEMMVVAAGEARRGKSMLLNALLGENCPLFPVDVNVCTNVVTIVRFGENEKIEALLGDKNSADGYRMESLSREQIPDYVSEKGNPDNYKNVAVLSICIPNELLKEGVVFVDTPGVGSLNISHAETTYHFLPNADLVLFVSDANSGLTESELNFLKRAYRYCQNIIFPLTKKDLNADFEEIVKDNRRKISRILEIPESSIEMIPVSSTSRLRSIERNNRVMYNISNYPEFEKAIRENISKNRAGILILPYLLEVMAELDKIAANIASQYQLLNADKEKMEEMIASLQTEVHRVGELQQSSARWKGQLADFCTLLSETIDGEIQKLENGMFHFLENRCEELKETICKKKVYSGVICEINESISGKILDMKSKISDEMEEEIKEIENELSLDLDVNKEALDSIHFSLNQKFRVSFPMKASAGKLRKEGKKIGIHSLGGGVIGGILGSIAGFCLGGPIGIEVGRNLGVVLGGALAGTKGCVDTLGSYDAPDVDIVKNALKEHITNSILEFHGTVEDAVGKLQMNIEDVFERKLQKRIDNIRDHIKKIENHVGCAKSEIPAKLEELEEQDKQVKAQQRLLEELENKISFSETQEGEVPCH